MTTRSCPHCCAPLSVVSSDEGTHFYSCAVHGAVDPKPDYTARLRQEMTGEEFRRLMIGEWEPPTS